MHTMLFKLSDGGIGSYPINPEHLALMTGMGLRRTVEAEAKQIANLMVPVVAENWPGFPLAFATEWVRAISRGGLIEAQAIDLNMRYWKLRRGYTVSTFVDHTAMPKEFELSATKEERYFRNAIVWEDTAANRCRCDMPKARSIHMDRIRLVRNKELERLDPLLMRANEQGNVLEAASIQQQKQVLRDIPQTFDLSGYVTPETLKGAWPAQLPPRVPL